LRLEDRELRSLEVRGKNTAVKGCPWFNHETCV
jgi:hypothetical protein